MLGIGTPELIVIGLVILIFYGPDRMPQLLSKINHFFQEFKMMGSDVSQQVRREMHRIESEVKTLEEDPEHKPHNKENQDPPHE